MAEHIKKARLVRQGDTVRVQSDLLGETTDVVRDVEVLLRLAGGAIVSLPVSADVVVIDIEDEDEIAAAEAMVEEDLPAP